MCIPRGEVAVSHSNTRWYHRLVSTLCLRLSLLVLIVRSATFALAISVICHPSLLSRQILAAIFIPIGTLLCLIPIPKFSHAPLRISCAASGAFGVVVSIALLAHIVSWGNVWEHFLATNSVDWGTSKEKALSATYCVLLPIGIACDWLLHRNIGANPDQVCVVWCESMDRF